jgi:hypothetical protein
MILGSPKMILGSPKMILGSPKMILGRPKMINEFAYSLPKLPTTHYSLLNTKNTQYKIISLYFIKIEI